MEALSWLGRVSEAVATLEALRLVTDVSCVLMHIRVQHADRLREDQSWEMSASIARRYEPLRASQLLHH
jgi:hypothetical protein